MAEEKQENTAQPQEELVLAEIRGRLGVITLNRPKAINSVNLEMLQLIDRALTRFEADSSVAGVLIQGAGERGLCAGGDIVSLYRAIEAEDEKAGIDFFRAEYSTNYRIATYPKPFISIMDGVTLGGGVGVSAHGSHRIVTEKSQVGMPETIIGFSPDIGGLKLLSQAPRQLGTALAMTGIYMNAGDALHNGFADHYVPSERLPELITHLETATDPDSIEQVISQYAEEPPASPLAENAHWIEEAFSGNDAVAIRNRVAEFAKTEEFAAEVLQALEHNSPTGIKMALYGVRRAKQTTLAEVLNADFAMAINAMRGHEMREGIRAQVIDKDKTPRWQPARLEEVEDDAAAAFFALPEGIEPLGLVEGKKA